MQRKPYRVLCVDDQGSVRSYLSYIFKRLGFDSVMVAANGAAAWDILQNEHIDLVVCDWQMPGMSGLELLKMIRAEGSLKNLPFIMVTGATDKAHVIEAAEAGVTNYVVKPFSEASISEAVKQTRMRRRTARRKN